VLSWLHVLSYSPVAVSGTGPLNDQVHAITEFFAGIPDVFSALFSKFGITWKKLQSTGGAMAPFLTCLELCDFLIASKLVKPHCSLAKVAELFGENVLETKGHLQQQVPFWHTTYIYYSTFVMIGLLRLACTKYSQKLTTVGARLSHLIEKRVRPSFHRPDSTLSHHAVVAQEELYGDLSMFLSSSEKQLLGRGSTESETTRIDDVAPESEDLRFENFFFTFFYQLLSLADFERIIKNCSWKMPNFWKDCFAPTSPLEATVLHGALRAHWIFQCFCKRIFRNDWPNQHTNYLDWGQQLACLE
jgi:hypothetical protein